MLTLQQIKANPDDIVRRLAIKGFDGKKAIYDVIELDNQRRALQLKNDNLAAELNKSAAMIGRLMKEGKKDEADQAKAEVASIKEAQKEIAVQLDSTEQQIREILLSVPNVPCDMVPEGRSAADNVVDKEGSNLRYSCTG